MARAGRKAKRPSADGLLDVLRPEAVQAFLAAVAASLGAASCPKPESTALWLLGLQKSGVNPSILEPLARMRGDDGVDHATYSARLVKMDHRVFASTMDRLLQDWVVQKWQAAGSPARVDAPTDALEHEYFAMSEREFQQGKRKRTRKVKVPEGYLRRARPHERRYWMHYCSAANKQSYWCTKYLGLFVTWLQGGCRVYLPVMFRIVPVGGDLPLDHAKAIVQTLNRLKAKGLAVRCVIADRWYDSPDFRGFIREAGYGFATRMRIRADQPRWVYVGGKKVDVVEELRVLAKDARRRAVEDVEEEIDWKAKENRTVVVRSRHLIMGASFESRGPVFKLLLRAAIKQVDGEWELDTTRSMVVAIDLDADPETIATIYRIRWIAELFYARLAEDGAADRPKRIETEVAQITAEVLHTALALHAQQVIYLEAPGFNILGVPIERWSKRLLARALLPTAYGPPGTFTSS